MEAKEPDVASARRAFANRLSIVVLAPFVAVVILAVMFFALNARVKSLDVGIRLANIERELRRDKDYALAVREYGRVAEGEKNALIYARLGRLYYSSGKQKAAIEGLNQAKRIDPACAEAYRVLTLIYANNDQAEDAIREGTRALALDPLDATTLNNLAWLHATSAKPGIVNLELAEKHAKKAVDLTNEDYHNCLDTLVEIYYRMGGSDRRDLALTYLRKAYALSPFDRLEYYRNRFRQMFPDKTPSIPVKEDIE